MRSKLMKTDRARYTAAFKAKVALAAVREHETIAQLAKRYGIHANQIYKWKKQFIDQAAVVFDSESKTSDGNHEREDDLLKKIGELTIERDFLARGLERRR